MITNELLLALLRSCRVGERCLTARRDTDAGHQGLTAVALVLAVVGGVAVVAATGAEYVNPLTVIVALTTPPVVPPENCTLSTV